MDGSNTSETCKVTVNAPVKSVKITESSVQVKVKNDYTLKASFSPADASNKNVKWSSSNEDIVEVSSCGVLSAKIAGEATITVTTVDGGKTAECYVRVLPEKAGENGSIIYKGYEYQIEVTPNFSKEQSFYDLGELVEEVDFKDIQTNWIKFIAGLTMDDQGLRGASIPGAYEKYGNEKPIPVQQEKNVTGAAVGNAIIGLFNSFVNSTTTYYINFRFEKHGVDRKERRVIIRVGNTENNKLYDEYAGTTVSAYNNRLKNRITSKEIAEFYHEMTGENIVEDWTYDIRITVDERHKDFIYSSKLWINKEGEIMEYPILHKYDVIEIGRIYGTIFKEYSRLCILDIDASKKANNEYQNLFGKIYN